MKFNYLDATGQIKEGVCDTCGFNTNRHEVNAPDHATEETIWLCRPCATALDHPDLAICDAQRYGRLLYETRKYGYMVNKITQEVRLNRTGELPPKPHVPMSKL